MLRKSVCAYQPRVYEAQCHVFSVDNILLYACTNGEEWLTKSQFDGNSTSISDVTGLAETLEHPRRLGEESLCRTLVFMQICARAQK
jgi:hypothetical protein